MKHKHHCKKPREEWPNDVLTPPWESKMKVSDKNLVNQVRENDVSSVKPDAHVGHKYDGSGLGVVGLSERFDDVSCDISDVVEERDSGANVHNVVEVAAAEEVDSDDVVECHLQEVILASVEEVREKPSNVVSHGDQEVLFELWRVWVIGYSFEVVNHLALATQAWRQKVRVLEYIVAPSSCPDEVNRLVNAEGSFAASELLHLQIFLFLAKRDKQHIHNFS